jgi:hypothetical protein
VARGRPTQQSSTAYRGVPERAVDGNTSGTYGNNSVTHTAPSAAPWWRVDLAGPHRVDGVTIWNRTDCCSQRLSNFRVDYLDAAGKVVATRDHAGKAGTQTDITLSASGVRAVRVQLRGSEALSLAEVQVWGAPDTGTGTGGSAGQQGVQVAHYALSGAISSMPNFSSLRPDQETTLPNIDLSRYAGTDAFGVVFKGLLRIDQTNDYVFQTISDDGSQLFIDGAKVVDNDGAHGPRAREGGVRLTAGYHPFELRFFENRGGETLQLNYKGGNIGSFTKVPDSMLSRTAPDTPPADQCPNDPNKTVPGICGCGVAEGTCETPTVTLPVEVLGAEGTTVERTFGLSNSQATSARSLWLQVNNLSYENKASVQINSGAWLSLNHATVSFPPKEKGYGGMAHGGLSTIRFSIPATGVRAGSNVVRFRFDRSDTISIGFRVVRMNLLDAAGKALLGPEVFVEDDPESWTAPYNAAASIAEGERLWREANLWSHYLPNARQGFWYNQSLAARRPIRAKCADCHTQDGRDLELFAYSNHSIIERSKFHGLTQREGELIASYIRSLSAKHDDVGRVGRPWDPPFQPGPEVAERPIWQWAAGAGLDAVLETDAEMLPDMFGSNPTKQSVAAFFDSDKMWDTSTQRVSIQLPDWKRWLPLVHPLDAFDRNGWIDGNITYHPVRGYQTLRTYFTTRQFPYGGLSGILSATRSFYLSHRRFFEQGGSSDNHWRTRDGDAVTQGLRPGLPVELAKTSLARLMAVKFFELHHEFQLHDKAPQLISAVDQPRARQWLGKQLQVFEPPPHFTSCETNVNCIAFLGQAEKVGAYESTAWYHLQQVVNPGMGMINQTSPVDFNYVPMFILYASGYSGLMEPLRFYYSSNLMYQTRTWSGATSPNNGVGFNIRVMGPWGFYGADNTNSHRGAGYGTLPKRLDALKPGLASWVMEAQLRQFLREVNRPENSLAVWIRQGASGSDDRSLEPASLSTSAMPNLSAPFKPAFFQYAQKIYWTLPKFAELGVDCTVLRDVAGWAKRAWPNVNWDSTLSRCL